MTDYKQYIDSRFISENATIKTRDRVPVVCPECGKCTVVYVSNLKARVKKHGNYKCRSCAGKEGFWIPFHNLRVELEYKNLQTGNLTENEKKILEKLRNICIARRKKQRKLDGSDKADKLLSETVESCRKILKSLKKEK